MICANPETSQVCRLIGADSLAFLSKQATLEAARGRSELCFACFTGEYPTGLYQSIEEANKDGKF